MVWRNEDGSWPRQALGNADFDHAYVVGVDDAGNVSVPIKIESTEWVETPASHPLDAIGYVTTTTLEQTFAVTTAPLPGATGTAGPTVVARSTEAWRKITPTPITPSARAGYAMVWDSARGQAVAFGGYGANGAPLGDTWVWNGGTWSRVATTGPSARRFHTMAFDSTHAQVVLFGGLDVNGATLGDTWVWDGSTWTQKSPGTSPRPQYGHAMELDQHALVMLFGSGETWTWNGSTWTQQAPSRSPSSRINHAMARDPSSGYVLLFGGYAGGIYLQDTWLWDGFTWTQQAPSASPPGRASHALAWDYVNGKVVLFGGQIGASTNLQDTWVWNGTTWTQKATSGPPARYSHAMAFDEGHHQVVLFGGRTSSMLADTWTWDGTKWVTPLMAPSARYAHALAYDSVRNRVVLFGGRDRVTDYPLQDTWEWDGTSWTFRTPPSSPPARGNHAMTFDPVRGRVVLYGGDYGFIPSTPSFLSDTWEWDGNTWTQRSPATSPSARSCSAMTFDAAHGGVVLLFGGWPGGYTNGWRNGLGDTWTWNGTNWSQQNPASSPGARSGSTMVHDVARGKVMMYANSSLGAGAGPWGWDGTTWTNLGPGLGADCALAYDAYESRVICLGYRFGLQAWLWDGTSFKDVTTSPMPTNPSPIAYDLARSRVVVVPALNQEVWERDTAPGRQPAIQFSPTGQGASQRVRVFGGASFYPGTGVPPTSTAGAALFAWDPASAPAGQWIPLATNATAAASQSPYLPPAPASLMAWNMSYADPRRFSSFQVRPLGAAGPDPDGARVAVDYIELRERYTAGQDGTPPTQLRYSSNPTLCRIGEQIVPDLPSSSGGAPGAYWIAPPLPPGLFLDAVTGAVSGTPRAAAPPTAYTVTAANAAGATTAALNLTVWDNPSVAPTNLRYWKNPVTFPAGAAASDAPSSGGGAVQTYSVSPSLPAGLVIDPTTGVVSGTSWTSAPATTYTVTASNAGGSTTVDLVITIGCVPTSISGNDCDNGLVCLANGTCGPCMLNSDCHIPLYCDTGTGQCMLAY
jgi:hypothetical protein